MLIDNVWAAESAHLETTTEAPQGLFASLGINWSQFIFQGINFLLVMLVIWYLILKPLTSKMTERQKMIDESLERAETIKRQMQENEVSRSKLLAEARGQAEQVLTQVQKEAAELKMRLTAETSAEIEILKTKAAEFLVKERESLRKEIRSETATLVVAALEKVLSKKVTAELDQKFIDSILAETKSLT